jgi:hypothetical protein
MIDDGSVAQHKEAIRSRTLQPPMVKVATVGRA